MAGTVELVDMLRAAGEPTRLRLLALLSEGEQSVKDLTEILGQSQPRVSRHLKLLADAGLVSRNAEGAWAYYGLCKDGTGGDLARWLIGRIAPGEPERGEDRDRLDAVRKARQAQAGAYFAKVAGSWDRLRALHVPEEAVEAAVLDAAPAMAELLLDLGTGTGRMLELLAGRYRHAIGIDSSREMLAVARAKLAAAGIGHVQVRLGDIAALDPSIGPADLIVVHQVLHYFDDPGQLIERVSRLLRPGGSLLVVDFAPHELEFLRAEHAHRRLGLGEAQMEGWAHAAGLQVAEFRLLPPAALDTGLTVSLWCLTAARGPATT